jgi:hypothetical protein
VGGHNSVAFTLTRYGGLFEDNTDAAIDRLDALLGGFSRRPRIALGVPSSYDQPSRAVAATQNAFARLELRSRSCQQEPTPRMSI